MTERPILFNGDMVRAILDGRKAQTRRPVRPQPGYLHALHGEASAWTDTAHEILCPHGKIGDLLWVRETWQMVCNTKRWTDYGWEPDVAWHDGTELPRSTHNMFHEQDWFIARRADGPDLTQEERGFPWRPSAHMPKWAARIWLRVANVRAERVQDISCADAIAEGILVQGNSATIDCDTRDPRDEFAELWDSIYADKGLSWDADNPWVWVIEFERAEAFVTE